jgi:hypothetical protein
MIKLVKLSIAIIFLVSLNLSAKELDFTKVTVLMCEETVSLQIMGADGFKNNNRQLTLKIVDGIVTMKTGGATRYYSGSDIASLSKGSLTIQNKWSNFQFLKTKSSIVFTLYQTQVGVGDSDKSILGDNFLGGLEMVISKGFCSVL